MKLVVEKGEISEERCSYLGILTGEEMDRKEWEVSRRALPPSLSKRVLEGFELFERNEYELKTNE